MENQEPKIENTKTVELTNEEIERIAKALYDAMDARVIGIEEAQVLAKKLLKLKKDAE